MTILLIGLDCDSTMTHFLRFCRNSGTDVDAINLREVALNGSWHLGIPASPKDFIRLGARTWILDDYRSMYVRPLDLTWKQKDPLIANRWAGLMSGLSAWLLTTDSLVINRPLSCAHNSSKPLHEDLISRVGLRVPPSLSTTDVNKVRDFVFTRPSVLKALGGDRGDAIVVTDSMLPCTEILPAPIHVQEYKAGLDVRAHVIRRRVFSVLIESDGVDYRRQDAHAVYSAFSLPGEIAEKVIDATRSFGVEFAGWDFKIDRDGVYWCLEANPQPGYNNYDVVLGGAISGALVELMTCDRMARDHDSIYR